MSTDVPGPARDLARLEEAGVLSRALIRAAEQVKASFAAAVEPLGLPVHLARAVIMLDEALPMSALADRLLCDPSYVTTLADQLEDRGLAERVPGTDRRVKRLALTADGWALRERIAAALSTTSIVLTRLDDGQRAALAPILAALEHEAHPPGEAREP